MKNKIIISLALVMALASTASYAACPPTLRPTTDRAAKTRDCAGLTGKKAFACGKNNTLATAIATMQNKARKDRAQMTLDIAKLRCDTKADIANFKDVPPGGTANPGGSNPGSAAQ